MNKSLQIFIVSDEPRAAVCHFEKGGRDYTFKTMLQDLEKGDLVVVENTSVNSELGYAVVRFSHYTEPDFDANWTFRWIVSKLPMDEFKTLLKNEEGILERIQEAELKDRRKKLHKQLVEDVDLDFGKVSLLEDQVASADHDDDIKKTWDERDDEDDDIKPPF